MLKGVYVYVCAAIMGVLNVSASADVFGTGANQFSIDFVTLTANPGVTRSTNTAGAQDENFTAGVGVSDYTDPGYDYRMGTFEITNDQWNKFKAELGVPVTGADGGYYCDPYWTGTNVPTGAVSWYEAAQFVNWLNTSKGYHAAYKFTGTQGQSDYALDTWLPSEADNGTNLYRHKDAFYYLPTEDEWVKAAYWNGTNLQTYATKPGDTLHQGDGVSGTGWNYWDNDYATDPYGPWDVGSGSEELNGTYDMMGNVFEWMESPYYSGDYGTGSYRGLRGGSCSIDDGYLASSYRDFDGTYSPYYEDDVSGFRVASEVPEPSSLGLVLFGGLMLLKRRRRA